MNRALPERQRHGSGRRCDGSTLLETLKAASVWLDAHVDRINALNVFPVPDGDTGTNLSLTVRAAIEAAEKHHGTDTGTVLRALAHGALLGARGNSGVILSQLLQGFAGALGSARELTARDVARALGEAARVAYRGVSRPVEGTLLTVAREVGEAAEAALKLEEDISSLLGHCVRAAELAVARTPEQLPVLARAGVVDAGGEGYRVLLEGAWMYLTGRQREVASSRASGQALARARDTEATAFGFCTEVVLGQPSRDIPAIRTSMEQLGDSVIVVGDHALVRIHVHTLRPGRVLEYAVDHGLVQQVKIENMQLQHDQFLASHRSAADKARQVGIVAVAAGDGFRDVFASLGVTAIVDGGPSMNPSVQDLLACVSDSACDELIILPNHRNIILTASHVKGLTSRTVEVLPTVNLPQGIAAAMAFNDQADLATNLARMREAMERLRVIELTRAARDAEAGRLRVTKGEYVAVLDQSIIASGREPCATLKQALETAGARTAELATLYYGQEVSSAAAETLVAELRSAFPLLEWEVVRGGQPCYLYIVSIE